MRILTLLFWALIFTAPSAELMKIQAAEDKFAYARSSRPNGNRTFMSLMERGQTHTVDQRSGMEQMARLLPGWHASRLYIRRKTRCNGC